jgi:hypothetical protein
MLTMIGIMPAAFSLNFDMRPEEFPRLAQAAREATADPALRRR